MKKSFFLLSLHLLLIEIVFSQNLSSVSGKIIDAKTKEPLAGAVVFLAQTSIGVYANENGLFTLDKIPSGKYDLTISMLGYKSLSIPFQFSGNVTNDFLITLEQAPKLLDSVVVIAHMKKQSRSDYTRFVKFFLGQTSNAHSCKILNPQDISVFTDQNNLVASARKPIIIENKALGYVIHYELKEFVFNPLLSLVTFSGTPRFEEVTPSSAKQKEKWIKERDRAYFGSSQHFLLSLKHGELSSNYYSVHNSNGVHLSEQDLMRDSLVYYKDRIYVSFEKELPEIYYSFKSGKQLSRVIFTGAPVLIYENGYFEDFHNLIFEGYIGWSSAIAELVPLGYQPTHKLKN